MLLVKTYGIMQGVGYLKMHKHNNSRNLIGLQLAVVKLTRSA